MLTPKRPSGLTEVVEAVTETGKPGKVTVTLSITRDKEMHHMVKIADSIKATIPVEPRRSLWFPDHDGTLHRNDPRQSSLFEPEQVEQINQEDSSK